MTTEIQIPQGNVTLLFSGKDFLITTHSDNIQQAIEDWLLNHTKDALAYSLRE